MRRIALGLLVIAVGASAGSGAGAAPGSPPATPPAKRKPATDRYPAEAIAPFVEAVLADKAGDLDIAQRRYEDANKISEQAHTHYNLGDLRRRMERWRRAVESYRKYLELAPSAPDRAEVEGLIAQLENRPGTAVIDGEDLDALVFVDGRLIGPSPVVLQVSDGRHIADRVTPTGFSHRTFEVRRADSEHVRMTASEASGNVILSGNIPMSGGWRDRELEFRIPGRIELPPGRHETYLVSPSYACSPLVFHAPPAGELMYVYVEVVGPREPRRGCQPIVIRQQKVRFAP